MSIDEAIKYLKQLYPNGGGTWLDEQRIEAISMAINALESKNEEFTSEELDSEILNYVSNLLGIKPEGRTIRTDGLCIKGNDLIKIARHFVQWQKEQIMKDAVALETEIFLEGGTTLQFKKGEIFLPDNNPKTSKFKAGDRVKLIIIKEG